jgi:hypothetical protein
MDKFVDKKGKLVLEIKDDGTELKDEKFFEDKKNCGHDETCPTCKDKEEKDP